MGLFSSNKEALDNLDKQLQGATKEMGAVASIPILGSILSTIGLGAAEKDYSGAVRLIEHAKKRNLIEKFRISHDIGSNAAFISSVKDNYSLWDILTGKGKDKILGKSIEASPGFAAKPGILAHEIGHAINFDKVVNGAKLKNTIPYGLYGMGTPSALISTLMQIAGGDKMTDNQRIGIATLGTAGTMPMLAEELSASAKGYKLLRKLGKGRWKSLSAFLGVPSYLGLSALPSAEYFIHKKLNDK